MRCGNHAINEVLESRVMRTDSIAQQTLTNGQISEFSGYALFAEISVGDNGDPWGMPTMAVGSSSEDAAFAYPFWDLNPWDRFDSGYQRVQLTADFSNDLITMGIEGGETAQFSGASCDDISSVVIRAGIQGPGMSAEWIDLNVTFFRDGEPAASTSAANGPAVSTLGQSNAQAQEEYTVFTPSGSGYDKVVVTGKFRMQADEGVYVSSHDIFGDILINC